MKKLKLSGLNLGSAEVLTREQLKKVVGGLSSSIYCTYAFEDSQGFPYLINGECSESMTDCNQSAIDACLSAAQSSGGCCIGASCKTV